MSARGTGLGPTERIAEIAGAELHYWVYREHLANPSEPDAAPVIVMVHGLRGSHQGLELVSERLPDRCVVIPDLPGFGDSTPMTGRRHDVRNYADALAGLVEQLGARPVVLLGHSFGSIIAAHLAHSDPDLVRRLVLVNPIASPPLRGSRVVLSGLASTYYSLGKALPEWMGMALLSNKWVVLAASRAMTRTRDKRVRNFVDKSHLRHFSRFHSPALLSETFTASVTRTVADYSDGLAMPTLLIAGETDEIAPPAGQQALAAALPDAQLVVVPQVGHLVHYETPGVAATEIERFLGAA